MYPRKLERIEICKKSLFFAIFLPILRQIREISTHEKYKKGRSRKLVPAKINTNKVAVNKATKKKKKFFLHTMKRENKC